MKALLTIVISLFAVSLFANLVDNKPFEFTQPDGTVLNLFVTGDEYYRRIHDDKDFTILIHPQTGYAVYAIPSVENIQASHYIVGKSDPASLGIVPNLRQNQEAAERRYLEQMVNRNNTRTPTTGQLDNVVCFVRFNDQTEFPTSQTFDWYNNLFNSNTQASMRNYYFEVSGGQLDLYSYLYSSSGGNVLSVRVGHDRDYYRPYHETTNPDGFRDDTELTNRHRDLIGELCGLLDPLVPESVNLDRDSDNKVDALTFVFRGATDGNNGILWPACWTWTASIGNINGREVWKYVIDFETGLNVSVICHEMGHVIGLPDQYRYNDQTIEPVRGWSLMSNDNAQHMTAYEKKKYLNWFASIPLITPTNTPTQYTLTSTFDNPFACYKISSTIQNQYYVLEYRRQAGLYEIGVPGTGLIVYRVTEELNGETLIGNAQGPPDEIYVYRPDGWINHNGNIDEANFNAYFNRTEIHSYTNPSPFLYQTAFTPTLGNLVITDVGNAGDWNTTITFSVSEFAPNIWTGAFSAGWGVYSNWSQNSVPTSDQYVIIPSGLTRYPVVSSYAECANLVIDTGASVNIFAGTLYVAGNLNNYGVLGLRDASAIIHVDGDLYFQPGSTSNITAPSTIQLYGDLYFSASTAINLSSSTLEFWGNRDSHIRIFDSVTLGNLYFYKDATHYTSLSGLSTETLTITGDFTVSGANIAYNNFSGNINLYGDLTVLYGGVFQFDTGTLSMTGNTHSYINSGSLSNYVNNLTINKGTDYSVTLGSILQVRNELTINSGFLEAPVTTLYVWGNWYNWAGPAAFTEGTGTVIFNGSADQYCPFSEDFYNFELRKTTGRFLTNTTTGTITCDHFDWTSGTIQVDYGTFTVADLIDDGIYGSWILGNAGSINLTNNDGYVDLNGNITIIDGIFNIYGGTDDSFWSFDGNSSITMSGGILDFKNRGVRVEDSAFSFSENITGGLIKTVGSFRVDRPEFTPSGGWIEFYGSADGYISHIPGANLWSVKFNKSAPVRYRETETQESYYDRFGNLNQLVRTNIITASTNLTLSGDVYIQRGTFTAPAIIRVGGNWTNAVGYNAFNEGTTGLVVFEGSGNSIVANETFYQLEISKTTGAEFQVPSECTVICGHYDWTSGTLSVSGGAFLALDLVDDAILGTIYLNNGLIYLYQDTAQYVDLGANITILSGELHVFGGMDSMIWPYAGNASLTMYGGVLNIHDRLVYVNAGNTFTVNITGGTIKCGNGFYCNRTDFNLTAGTVELYSTTDAYLNMMAGSLHDIVIFKSARADTEQDVLSSGSNRLGIRPVHTRTNTVTLLANISCHELTVNAGNLFTNGRNITLSDDLTINSGGNFILGQSGTLYMYNAKHLIVNAGGSFYSYGTYDVRALVTTSTGYFHFWVESGGTIKADYTDFEKITASGLYVKPGATVDPAHSFYFCSFKNGQAGGTLLTLDNDQNMWLAYANFPPNTWSGASNVRKTVNAGVVNFHNSFGTFSGETFDNDVYSRLFWNFAAGQYDLQILKAVWSNPTPLLGETVELTVTCLNNGTAPCENVNVYLDYYEDLVNPPITYQYGEAWIQLGYLPGGVPVDFTYNITNENIAYAGEWTSWLQIDTDNAVAETNETNNVYGPFTINWVYLPPITDLTIEKAGIVSWRLDWTYTVPCDRFNIYRSSVPDFVPSPANLLTSVSYPTTVYVDPSTGLSRFYIVRAESDMEPSDRPASAATVNVRQVRGKHPPRN